MVHLLIDEVMPSYKRIQYSGVFCASQARCLDIETGIWITDSDGRRRFVRYCLLIGAFTALIRRLAMLALVAELGRPVRAPIEGEIEIAQPPETVFDTVADERNEPRYNRRLSDVEKITPGPIGQGTRFRARTAARRRGLEMIIEFTEFDRPHRLNSFTRLGSMEIGYSLTFEPIPGGTRMRWSGDLRPRGPLALFKPVLNWIGRRQEISIWRSLKSYLESSSSQVPTPDDDGPSQTARDPAI
jgi:Polyketide cyclase / dehydrase and lipid transport